MKALANGISNSEYENDEEVNNVYRLDFCFHM